MLFRSSSLSSPFSLLSFFPLYPLSTLPRREELRLLKEELVEEYEADKQAALSQLTQQKDVEMMAAREGWQRKVEDLLEQVLISHAQF